MESHKRILGIIYLAYGLFTCLILTLVYLLIFGIMWHEISYTISHREEDFILMLIHAIFMFVGIIIVIPSIIGGIAVLANRKWGMIVLVVVGCLNLLNFPIGTAIGGYTLWVFFKEQELERQGMATETFEERSN